MVRNNVVSIDVMITSSLRIDVIILGIFYFLFSSFLIFYFPSKMGPQDGLCQKLQNCVNICQSYSEKTIGFFFPDTVYIAKWHFSQLYQVIKLKKLIGC